LPSRKKAQPKARLQQISDPLSSEYRHFLTVKEFTDEYGPSPDDYLKVVDFCPGEGIRGD
jgi:subtilase family serine protease